MSPSGIAFVLGGGGVLGANEVGMLDALLGAGIRPDLVLGTSIGAINGAVLAAEPSIEAVRDLSSLWIATPSTVWRTSAVSQVRAVAQTKTALQTTDRLRGLLVQ